MLQDIGAWYSGCLALQRQVNALVAAVLLGMTWLDALHGDAEGPPPDGELGEVELGVGAGGRDAVVGSDGTRQSALSEQVLEGGGRAVLADGPEGLAKQQIA